MKILLLGEYSGLHVTLAQGLRALGHEVTVASDGCKWMNNERDIDLTRTGFDLYHSLRYLSKTHLAFRNFKNYDVVQIKSPSFLDLTIKRNLEFYRFLLKNNAKVFLGAFGTDYFWEKLCVENTILEYSDLYVGKKPLNIYTCEWLMSPFKEANIEIAETCHGIISCLYEYHQSYKHYYDSKLAYIPLPINTDILRFTPKKKEASAVHFFIGIQKLKSKLKGTDVMLAELLQLQQKFPNEVRIQQVTSLPWKEYLNAMSQSEVILDQLYSYTPAMNGLLGMAQGLVLVGGGEPEMYDLLQESENRPIINVFPSKEAVRYQLEQLIANKKIIPEMAYNSRKFVEEHHNYCLVAQQYLDFWNSK